MTNEAALIARIRRAVPSRPGGILRLGIGDDAAVLQCLARPSPSRRLPANWILTSDSFLEGRHFLVDRHPPESVGFKALARALSDVAAMGAVPRVFLLNLALPSNLTGTWLNRFLQGMARAARAAGVTLAGGDVAQSRSVAIFIALLGQAPSGRPVLRSGARPGDSLFLSGTLGAAQLGLEAILRSGKQRSRSLRHHLLERHLYPTPRLALGLWLANNHLAAAMIDTSDGFSTALSQLCQASRVGACVKSVGLPVVRIPSQLRRWRLSAQRLALHGGEDYELLFAVHPESVPRIPKSFGRVPISNVGTLVRRREILLLDADGETSVLPPLGWDHFR